MPRISTHPLADQPLGALPSTNDRRPQPLHWPPAGAGRQVPTFHTRAQAKLAPPPCRTPPGQSAGTRQAHPGPSWQTRFRCHLYQPFDTSSVDRSRSPSWPTPDALNGAPFPATLTTTALDRSSSRWFAASPCRATAEDHQPNRPGPSISDAAPHQSVRPSTSTSLLRSWHTRDRLAHRRGRSHARDRQKKGPERRSFGGPRAPTGTPWEG